MTFVGDVLSSQYELVPAEKGSEFWYASAVYPYHIGPTYIGAPLRHAKTRPPVRSTF